MSSHCCFRGSGAPLEGSQNAVWLSIYHLSHCGHRLFWYHYRVFTSTSHRVSAHTTRLRQAGWPAGRFSYDEEEVAGSSIFIVIDSTRVSAVSKKMVRMQCFYTCKIVHWIHPSSPQTFCCPSLMIFKGEMMETWMHVSCKHFSHWWTYFQYWPMKSSSHTSCYCMLILLPTDYRPTVHSINRSSQQDAGMLEKVSSHPGHWVQATRWSQSDVGSLITWQLWPT